MPVDTFICGSCHTTYNDIADFIEHKKNPCEPAPEEVNIHIVEQGDNAVQIVAEALSQSFDSAEVKTEVDDGDPTVQHVQLIQVPVSDGVRLTQEQAEAVMKAASQSTTLLEGSGPTFLKLTSPLVVHDDTGDAAPAKPAKPPGRKRGRPRKGEEKNKPVVAAVEKPKEKEPKDASVSIDNDGRLHCPRCKRTFTRLRHYNTHRCLADSDYIDISKKEAVPDLENEVESDPDLDDDYVAPLPKPSPRAKRIKIEKVPVPEPEPIQVLDSGEKEEPNVTIETNPDAIAEGPDGAAIYASSTTAPLKQRPIFETDEELKQFNENLNIDLSQIDHMFKTHIIEQNVNEHAPPPANRISPELTIFSCNTCDKVFKTISHMRHHCLIHTNLKPFKCPKCDYASNSKGNLYTHIRKHTGQFFNCPRCQFKTVNRSHLNEHLGTHNIRKIKCRICKKDYSTNKSLYNHVRKYHAKTVEGVEYLKEFTPRVNKGQAVLHQCHVCNRKFKKRMDRDRHLFIHNIKSNPNVFACELCEYTASRRIYLENHIRKHRIVYQCAVCRQKFLSTIRLNDHISEKHLGDIAPEPTDKDWGDLFEASINSSLYLPEPDGTIDHLGQAYLKPGQKSDVPEEVVKEECDTLIELKEAIAEIKEQSSEGVEVSQIIQQLAAPLQTESDSLRATSESPAQTILVGSSAQAISSASHVVVTPEVAVACGGVVQLESQSECVLQTNVEGALAPDSEVPVESETTNESSAMHPGSSPEVNMESTSQGPIESLAKLPVESMANTSMEIATETGSQSPPPRETAQEPSEDANRILMNENDQDADNDPNPEDLESLEGPIPREILGTASDMPTAEEQRADIFQKLEYQQMSMDILTKLRETFGNQECEFCGRLFYSQLDYEPHVRTHTGDKPFACDECDYRSITRENLKRHRERHHHNVSLKCDRCDFVASGRTQLWTHKHKHKEAESPSSICPVCQNVFESKKALGAHILMTHPDMSREDAKKATGYNHRIQGKIGRRSYKCPYCDKVFTRANSDLQKHIWIHEGIKPYKCNLCPHACRSMNNLKNHMLRHSQNKPFMCGDCGKLYKSRTALRWHMRSHREGRIFKCNRCPYEAVQKSHLKRHMETHDVIKKYVCEYCDYSANTLGYMKIHHTKFHKDLPQKDDFAPTQSTVKELPPNTKAFKCLSCDYIFGNIWDIKRHLKVRHHLHVEDIRALETTEVSRIVPADVVAGQETEIATGVEGVEVIEVNDLPVETLVRNQTDEDDASEALETLRFSAVPNAENETMDEKTASAVNILQQIIDMSQQGAFPSQSQQITVQGQDGQMMTVNPETIIVQQDGQELVVASDGQTIESSEFVIQVMNDANCVSGTETIVSSAEGTTVTIPEVVTEVLTAPTGSDFFQTEQEDVPVNVITTEPDITG